MVSTAWSFSSLSAFEQCPLRYKLTRVNKVVKEPDTEATLWGKRVHTAFEKRIRDGKPFPALLAGYEPIAAKVSDSGGEIKVEMKIGVNRSFGATDFFAKDVWCRGVIDFVVIKDAKAVVLDWKTGKQKPGSDQLKLSAGMAFAKFPNVDVVDTGFVWLKNNKVDRDTFTREHVGDIWSSFMPRVERLNMAFENNRWPANPSGLCKNYCPVGKSNCEFCGK